MGSAFSNSTLREEFKKTKDFWDNRCASKQQGPSLEENIETIHRELKKIKKDGNLRKKKERQSAAGIFLVHFGSFDVIAQKALEDLWPKGQSDIGGDGKEPHALLSIALATDGSDDVCDAVLQYPELYEALLFRTREILESLRQESKCPSTLLGCVDILHNISLYLEDMEERDSLVDREHPTWYLKKANAFTGKMREDTTDILNKCIEANKTEIRLKAMSALACLVTKGEAPGQDEEQGELIDPTILTELINHFGMVLHETSNLSAQCSALAIERGLRHLLRSNDEKTRPKLTTNIVVDLLISGLNEAKIVDEERACFSSLWMLHFDSECFKMMAKPASLVDLLKKKKAVKGTRRAKSMRKALQDFEKPNQTALPPKHVMFSYQHHNQEIVTKICEHLKSKDIKTWIDIDQMRKKRNIYQAMGRAVEEAEVFVMCMSKTYNHSENCEREATYACEKKKPIIVLRLESDCQPNGWLGIIATGRLYIDFSKLEDYDKNCDDLLKRIQEMRQRGTIEDQEQNNDNAGAGSNGEGTGQLKKDEGKALVTRPNPPANGKAQRQAIRHSTVLLTSKEQEKPLQHEKQTASRSSTVPPTSKEQPLQHEKQTTNRGSTTPSTSKQTDQILQRAKQTYSRGNSTRRSVKLSTRDANTTQSLQYLPQDRSVERGEDSIELKRNELLYRVKLPHMVPEVFHKRMGKGLMMKTAHEVSRLTELLNGYQLSSGSMTVVHCTF